MKTKETCEYRVAVPWYNDWTNHTGYKKHPDPCIVCNAREEGRKEIAEEVIVMSDQEDLKSIVLDVVALCTDYVSDE